MRPPRAAAGAVQLYQGVLEEFRRGEGDRPRLLKSISELVSLLDLTSTLAASRSNAEALDAALLTAMGELQAARGAVLVRRDDGCLELGRARGVAGATAGARFAAPPRDGLLMQEDAAGCDAMRELGLALLCPILRAGGPIAFVGLGPRADGRGYAAQDVAWLVALASCAAAPLENSLIYEELLSLNRRLQAKLFQLQNLFDLSRELTSSLDEDAINNVVTATLIGHLVASRCAFYEARPEGFVLSHGRGVRSGDETPLPAAAVAAALLAAPAATEVASLPDGVLKQRLSAARLSHLVRLTAGGRDQGFFAIGGRAPGAPLDDGDVEFAIALGRQALAALETVRLHRVRLLKERQDRELQIARGIQQSLFPRAWPALPGYELAARSESCYEIGGDYYDFIPLADGRVALVVADVSGKGTPASLLMASVHASLQALAGGTEPAALIERLNRFLYLNTQANKFVTLFYAELDPRRGELLYVNAGHVPPFVRGAAGRGRLEAGGPALGLLEDARFDQGRLALRPGDVVAVVTDGATEALSPVEEEFGDERVFEALSGDGGEAALLALFEAVHRWSGERGCSDDLTALVLKAG